MAECDGQQHLEIVRACGKKLITNVQCLACTDITKILLAGHDAIRFVSDIHKNVTTTYLPPISYIYGLRRLSNRKSRGVASFIEVLLTVKGTKRYLLSRWRHLY